MRYYVVSIQYNKEVEAENRTAPAAFNTYNEAKQKFHSILASDMSNPTLGWSICLIFTNDGGVLDCEKWVREE